MDQVSLLKARIARSFPNARGPFRDKVEQVGTKVATILANNQFSDLHNIAAFVSEQAGRNLIIVWLPPNRMAEMQKVIDVLKANGIPESKTLPGILTLDDVNIMIEGPDFWFTPCGKSESVK